MSAIQTGIFELAIMLCLHIDPALSGPMLDRRSWRRMNGLPVSQLVDYQIHFCLPVI
jgi:hypothetical protein